MISATTAHTGASKQIHGLTAHEHDRARLRGQPGHPVASAGVDSNSASSAPNRRHRSGFSSGSYPTTASREGIRDHNQNDTPAELLESMIMQMGGGPYSTYKGMYINLVV